MGIYETISGEEDPNEAKGIEYKTYHSLEELEEKGVYWIKQSSEYIAPALKKDHIENLKIPFPIEAWYQPPLEDYCFEYKPKANPNQHPFEKFRNKF